ncbi:MAG: PAS domain S-box protein [Flavitalea sp.]
MAKSHPNPVNTSNIQELENKVSRLRKILDSSLDVICSIDENGCYIEVNAACQNLWGYEPQHLIGKNYLDLIIECDREKTIKATDNIFRGGKISFENQVKKMDGATMHMLWSANYDEIEKIMYFTGRDLSERKLAERVEKLLQSFMHNTPTLTWILDENACFRYLNPIYIKTFHLSEDFVGKSIYDIFPKHICDSYIKNNNRVWELNTAIETIEDAITPDGKLLILQIFKFPLGDDNGVRLIGGTALDISQITITKDKLQQINEQYAFAAKATSDAIWDWDLQQNIIFRGIGYETLFGYKSQTETYDEGMEHIHPNDIHNIKQALATAFTGDTDRMEIEYRFQCYDGTYKNVLDKAYIIRDEHNKPRRIIGAMQDMTQQRLLEKKLVEEVTRKKTDIISAIIDSQEKERIEISTELHDNVNQILATCKLYLEIAQSDPLRCNFSLKQSYESVQLAISEIRKISHHLNPPALNDIGLLSALKELIENINPASGFQIYLAHGKLVENNMTPDLKLAVYRIIQEQLNNIVKHAQATIVSIDLRLISGRLCLTIKDNGKGFNVLETKKGLGLNNIANRAANFKGKFKVISEPSKGCKLAISIPLPKEIIEA